MVVPNLTDRVVVVVRCEEIRMEGGVEVEKGEIREITASRSIHKLPHPGQQAGVELGGTETVTGTTLTNVLVVGIDGEIRTTNNSL